MGESEGCLQQSPALSLSSTFLHSNTGFIHCSVPLLSLAGCLHTLGASQLKGYFVVGTDPADLTPVVAAE